MADESVTVANTRFYGNLTEMVGGEAGITPGMVLYADATASNKVKGASRDVGVAEAKALYIAADYGGLDDKIHVQSTGSYNPGFTVVVGEIYCVGTGVGGIEGVDGFVSGSGVIATGEFMTVIGVGITTALILLGFIHADAAHV